MLAPRRKRRRLDPFLLLGVPCALLLVIAGVAIVGRVDVGPSTVTIKKETRPAAPKIWRTGEAVLLDDALAYRVSGCWYTVRLSENEFLNVSPKSDYLVVELSVANRDRVPHAIPRLNLVDDRGAVHTLSPHSYRADRALAIGEPLNPGVRAKGVVAFDVPHGRRYRLVVEGPARSMALVALEVDPNWPPGESQIRQQIERETQRD